MTSKPAAAPTDIRLGHISLFILYARDVMKSLPFYRDLLGMKVVEASPHWVQLDGGGVHLALHPHPAFPDKLGVAHPWVVFDVADVHGAYQALLAKGLKFTSPPKEVTSDATSVGLSADFEDPDGNRLSLFGTVKK